MDMVVKLLQLVKGLLRMLVTLFGIETEAREVHSLNAPPPMAMTLSGMEMENKALQSENAPL